MSERAARALQLRSVVVSAPDDFESWRESARSLARACVPPDELVWTVGDRGDLLADTKPLPRASKPLAVPRAFADLAKTVICHRDGERFGLLYALLWRLQRNPRSMNDSADPLLIRLQAMARSVRRDIHKMRAFLRFRQVRDADGEPRYVAWFEPEHHIVRVNSAFFIRRFANMRWTILTPELSLHWQDGMLREGPPATRALAPAADAAETAWKTYYASIFNPARIKVGAMLKEMPRRYWKNMPETALIPQLIQGAQHREREMVAASAARLGDNVAKSWESIRSEAMECTRCPLHECGTQTVFGEGPLDARILFVGEQPGDQEDLAGRPFVGPAGRMLDRALGDAGVDRSRTYVTNAVKHFKFVRRGKRRIHDKPNGGEIAACRWWLQQELALIRPAVTVALGATAARAVFGKVVTISSLRGAPHALDEVGETWVTVHPSFLLRVRDDREAEYARFVEDLHRIGERAKALEKAETG